MEDRFTTSPLVEMYVVYPLENNASFYDPILQRAMSGYGHSFGIGTFDFDLDLTYCTPFGLVVT